MSVQTPFAAQLEMLRGSVVWAAMPTLRGRLPVRGVVVSATCRTAADALLTAITHGAQPPAGTDASVMAPPSTAIDLHQLLSMGGWSVSGSPVRHVTNFAYPLTAAAGGKATLWVTAALIGGRCRVFNQFAPLNFQLRHRPHPLTHPARASDLMEGANDALRGGHGAG